MSAVIREANSDDVSILCRIIRHAFEDVARRLGLNPENCPKHPSNCKEQWVENDFSRGVSYFLLEVNGLPLGCAALEIAGKNQCYPNDYVSP